MTNYRAILEYHYKGNTTTQVVRICECSRTTVLKTIKRAKECGLTQSSVIKLISEINIRGQVLLTTHSPLTLNKINKENIRILKDGEIYSLTVDSFNRDVVQILEEIMEVPKRPKEVEDAIKHFRNAVMHNQKDEANKARTFISSWIEEICSFAIRIY